MALEPGFEQGGCESLAPVQSKMRFLGVPLKIRMDFLDFGISGLIAIPAKKIWADSDSC